MLSTSELQVKTNSAGAFKACGKVSGLWLLYFILSIGTLGFVAGFVLFIPMKIVARLGVFRRAVDVWADLIFSRSIALLMFVQPWFRGEIDLNLPSILDRHGRGLLLVSNHRSHVDAFILLMNVPGIRILAKRSLFLVPFLNLFMWVSRQIPVPQGDIKGFLNAMDAVAEGLKDGHVVHVFPEMTRCQPGFSGTKSFSLAPFLAAQRANANVLPIMFRGTDHVWPKGSRGLRFGAPVVAKSLGLLVASDFATAKDLRDEAQRLINQALA